MLPRLVALVLALSVARAPAAPQAGKTDPELERGIAQVREGDFASAVMTLDELARRLAEKRDQPRLLARAYVYLSVAYLGLSQVEAARATFLEALDTDNRIELTPEEFPPRFLTFFEETMKDREAAGTTTPEEKKPEDALTATPPEAAPPSVSSKGGSKKWLALAGAGAAAGVGIALAGGGGGGGGTDAPASTPETPLQTTYFSSQISCLDPYDDCPFPVTRAGTIEATLNWIEADAEIAMSLTQTDPTVRHDVAWSTPIGSKSESLTYTTSETGSYRLNPYWKQRSCRDPLSPGLCTCPTATYTITVRHP
jgi:hypothetical protein